MGSSTGVAFHQLHPQPQEVLAKGLEAPGAANYVAAFTLVLRRGCGVSFSPTIIGK